MSDKADRQLEATTRLGEALDSLGLSAADAMNALLNITASHLISTSLHLPHVLQLAVDAAVIDRLTRMVRDVRAEAHSPDFDEKLAAFIQSKKEGENHESH